MNATFFYVQCRFFDSRDTSVLIFEPTFNYAMHVRVTRIEHPLAGQRNRNATHETAAQNFARPYLPFHKRSCCTHNEHSERGRDFDRVNDSSGSQEANLGSSVDSDRLNDSFGTREANLVHLSTFDRVNNSSSSQQRISRIFPRSHVFICCVRVVPVHIVEMSRNSCI